jgi:5'-nucleotidase
MFNRLRIRAAVAVALAAAMLSMLGGFALPVVQAQSTAPSVAVPLRLIAFNDFHGHLASGDLSLTLNDPDDPSRPLRVAAGGAAQMAGLMKALREGAANSVVISSGDMLGAAPLVSTLFRHESTVEAMNLAGVDVAIVGNHEFDAGFDELKRLQRGGCAVNPPEAATTSCVRQVDAGATAAGAEVQRYVGMRFPLLGANVVDASGKPVFAPYLVREVQGIKVGFIGVVTRTTPSIVRPSAVRGLRFLDEADTVNQTARVLKAQGVNVLVAIFHEGGEIGEDGKRADWNDPACPGARGDLFDLLKRLGPEIDVIFSAHTHQGYRCTIAGRPVMQASSYGRGLSVVDLWLDPATGGVLHDKTRALNVPVLNANAQANVRQKAIGATAQLAPDIADALRRASPDDGVAALVQTYSAMAAPKANRPVGRVLASFDRQGMVDTKAGRLIADSQLAATQGPEQGGAQVAFMNPGGVRADLACKEVPPCTVTYGQVFTMQPFGNSLVVMTLSGAQIKELLEAQWRESNGRASFLSPSAGLRYRWKNNEAAGAHVQELSLNGKPIRPDAQYRVTVNSFLAEGGDGYRVLTKGGQRVGGGQDVDVLLDYLNSPTPRAPDPESRITLIE